MFYVVRLTTNKDSLFLIVRLPSGVSSRTLTLCKRTQTRTKTGKETKNSTNDSWQCEEEKFLLLLLLILLASIFLRHTHTSVQLKEREREGYIRATFGIIICNLSYSMGSTNIFWRVRERERKIHTTAERYNFCFLFLRRRWCGIEPGINSKQFNTLVRWNV
jgi:hypothetical protein